MANQGFVVLYRKFLSWEWIDNPNMVGLFINLLLLANFQDKEWHGIIIKRGQFLTSIAHLSKKVGLSVRQTRTALDRLKTTNEITSETTTSYTVITVLNYNKYQDYDKPNDKRMTNERQTDDKRMTTTNNDNNVNNENKDNNNIYLAPIGAGTNHLISLFAKVNPFYKTLYANKTQRSALERMTKELGEEKMISLISILHEVIYKPYCPQITTPLELENKMGKLIVFLQQEKLKIAKRGTTKI